MFISFEAVFNWSQIFIHGNFNKTNNCNNNLCDFCIDFLESEFNRTFIGPFRHDKKYSNERNLFVIDRAGID